MKELYLSLTIKCESPELITRALETLARTAAGLAMEGVTVSLMISPEEEESGTPYG